MNSSEWLPQSSHLYSCRCFI